MSCLMCVEVDMFLAGIMKLTHLCVESVEQGVSDNKIVRSNFGKHAHGFAYCELDPLVALLATPVGAIRVGVDPIAFFVALDVFWWCVTDSS